ncbi:nuclear factor 7, brain-like [Rhinoderma darwinii]|uniref:nuclear factor 7, brain-like n=1 Tax=Rhinoderma darwinii TaxID=43563 RepID=UPI003F6714DE
MASADMSCSVCLDLYTDPVTLRCGHNFCRDCIDRVLDTQNRSGDYACPDCRARFMGRPALQGNVTQRNREIPFCAYCLHVSAPAVKSCLHCEASLCHDHLRVHSKSSEHVLCDPTTNLENRKCSVHKKILEYYCTQDSTLICVSCRLEGEHVGHHVESLDEASEKKRSQLFQLLQQLESRKFEMEKRFQSLEERRGSVRDKAALITKEITAMFGDLRRQLEDLEKKVLLEVSRQEEQVSLTVSDLIQQLEIKKDEISKKIRQTEARCHMTDSVTVLQEPVKCRKEFCDEKDLMAGRFRDDGESHEVDLCKGQISNTLNNLNDIIGSVTRGIYIPDPTDIILDVNTSGDYINVSNDLKMAAYSESKNILPKTPERFECNQILSTERFSSGEHYWDVEGSEWGMWRVGVAYPSIDRTGTKSMIGNDDRSWALEYFIGEYSAIHDSEEVKVSDAIYCRLRIHLDYEAGQLSFYELSHPIKHLYTFTAIFTEPLHAAFWVGWDDVFKDSWVKIEDCKK